MQALTLICKAGDLPILGIHQTTILQQKRGGMGSVKAHSNPFWLRGTVVGKLASVVITDCSSVVIPHSFLLLFWLLCALDGPFQIGPKTRQQKVLKDRLAIGRCHFLLLGYSLHHHTWLPKQLRTPLCCAKICK